MDVASLAALQRSSSRSVTFDMTVWPNRELTVRSSTCVHGLPLPGHSPREAEALDQVARYLDRAGLGEGWLVMFDLRKEVSWPDKLFVREVVFPRQETR